MFPPGRSIWCNNQPTGPTTRPTAIKGGHTCCNNSDFCNGHLKPRIFDYSNHPNSIFDKGGNVVFRACLRVIFFFIFICFLL